MPPQVATKVATTRQTVAQRLHRLTMDESAARTSRAGQRARRGENLFYDVSTLRPPDHVFAPYSDALRRVCGILLCGRILGLGVRPKWCDRDPPVRQAAYAGMLPIPSRCAALLIALLAIVGRVLVSGAATDRGSHVPDLICSGDPIWPVGPRPQGQPRRPWNMEALRKLCAFGDAEQRAWAEKAVNAIWTGRSGWCPVK